jgi:hypothetical protein
LGVLYILFWRLFHLADDSDQFLEKFGLVAFVLLEDLIDFKVVGDDLFWIGAGIHLSTRFYV